MQLPHFKKVFGVHIKDDTSAKDNFETIQGGSVYAVGAGGTITGRGSGIKGTNRFGGAFIMDDMHKPDEVSSDTMREAVCDWFFNTAMSRVNTPTTPMIFIGQCLHEDDLSSKLVKTGEWTVIKIPALDACNNALHPEMHNLQQLLKMKEQSPYVFAAQYQQNPQPAGGGIFKPEWFYLMDDEPDILATFITVDSAETDKDYNDATAFSFFGIYRIVDDHIDNDLYAIHWIDCVELRVEPKDLKNEFLQFYASCMRHRVKPKITAIEKKSTGVTLSSSLESVRGLTVLNIDRTKASGSKTTRFLEIQSFVAGGQVSLPANGRHTKLCLEHCRKITANNSHRFDDICDTLADGVKLALIDKVIHTSYNNTSSNDVAKRIMSKFHSVNRLREQRTW